MHIIHMNIIATQYVELMDSIQFDAKKTMYLKFGSENVHAFMDHITMMNMMIANERLG